MKYFEVIPGLLLPRTISIEHYEIIDMTLSVLLKGFLLLSSQRSMYNFLLATRSVH